MVDEELCLFCLVADQKQVAEMELHFAEDSVAVWVDSAVEYSGEELDSVVVYSDSDYSDVVLDFVDAVDSVAEHSASADFAAER